MDFIDKYISLMSKITDAPRDFQEACAMFLLSTVVGRSFVFQSLPDVNIYDTGAGGGRLLNLWFAIIGRSRISRKSSVIKNVEDSLSKLDEELLLPVDFTPQALTKVITEKYKNNETRCCWINDEISGFFESLRRADFMVSADALLSRIYDGKNTTRTTIVRGAEKIIRPYLTVLVASTEYLPSLFDEGKLRQGFLNRFIFVVSKRTNRLELRSTLTNAEEKITQEIFDYLQAIYTKGLVTSLGFTSDAKKVYNDFEAMIEERITKESLGIEEGYFGNLPNFVIRIGSLFRISRMTTEEIVAWERPILLVEETDVRRAIEYCAKVWNWFQEVVSMMKTTAHSREVFTEENKIEMVYRIIKGSENHVTRSELARQSKLLPEDLDQVVDALVAQDRIVKVIEKTKGRNRIMYRLKDEHEDEENGKEE